MRLSITVALLLIACGGRPPEASDLVGEYVIEYPYGRETLVLSTTGSYSQRFTGKDGRSAHNTGKWEMNGHELLLRDAMDVDNGFGNLGDPSQRMDWHLKPERSNGIIVIVVNPDRKERYEKRR